MYLKPVRAKPIPPNSRITPMESRLWGLPKGRIRDRALARKQTTRRTTPRATNMAPCTTRPRSIFRGKAGPYSSMYILT